MADRPKDPLDDGSARREVGDYTSQLPRPVDPWGTRAGQPTGPEQPPVDPTSAQPPGGAPPAQPTAPVSPPGGATSQYPTSETGGPREPAWSGRAGVPVRPSGGGGGGSGGWSGQPEAEGWDRPGQPGTTGRPWWLPILIGVLVLLLVALVGVLIWWASSLGDQQNPDDDAPDRDPVPTASAAPTQPQTDQPETDEPPAPEPTEEQPTEATTVPVPQLTGLSEAQARSALDDLDLVYRLQLQPSDQPAGTVIETDPPAGTQVEPGTEILLVVADAGSGQSPEPTDSAEPTGEPTDGDDD
ncbi:PASTA domain-containing protein [Micromonospora sp. NBC_01813]|uniref:PASTA domain-containing protein n=1 Tax=Micromonospora sp. NBC_01813 TaxID=2975988 RepID=UPI002DD9B6D4|nr:PASTA domain-containing protein [Micromonospora sp. NBC_01813]WSA07474.1 PASTA domain-containing protein [Micromonospora sp. NBC_01813]